ncbi:CDP-glucose 4,6-dehydratase [Nocardioides stalactiti]|uniref:CDP-glucose 4,6-dehydratase n=1 Tax=Nocardioides stalactiti TaxID=2755356 RepID=UPI001604861C|nr:CDP-glucose 4,6-dehydratase [Nocardioides stalactiti]
MLPTRSFWEGRRVLLTGHTGFKGSWTALWLERLGADVAGYALAPDQSPALHDLLAPFDRASSTIADLADHERLRTVVTGFAPQVVLHLAAQPLVRRSYREPRETFAANVQGTVNVLDAAREVEGLEAVLVVTTDKVYANAGVPTAFVEDDRLGGHDPYSASKAACEIATASYRASFLGPAGVGVGTARAGNVVGGGDWSEDRLVPDVWRAVRAGRPLELRYPDATRPWQHVLEPIAGYLLHAEALASAPATAPLALNFGPAPGTPESTVAEVADAVARELGAEHGWVQAPGDHPPEMATLALDASQAIATLGWSPRLDPGTTLRWTAEWYRDHDAGADARDLTLAQIERYEELA